MLAGAGDNSVNAVDLNSGRFLWDVPLGRYESTSLAHPGVTVFDGHVYSSGVPGVLTAIRLADQSIRWLYPMDPSGDTEGYFSQVGGPHVVQDRIFIGTHETSAINYVHAIDRDTGTRIWRKELGYNGGGYERGMTGGLNFVDGTLLIPAGDLIAVDASTGETRWEFAVEPTVAGVSTPVVSNGRVYIKGATEVTEGRLYCLDLATGSTIWSISAGNTWGGFSRPSVVGGAVFATFEGGGSTLGDGTAFVADANTGAIRWSNPDVDVESSLTFANGQLFFLGFDRKGGGDVGQRDGVVAMDAATGQLLWVNNRVAFTRATTPLVVADNGVF